VVGGLGIDYRAARRVALIGGWLEVATFA